MLTIYLTAAYMSLPDNLVIPSVLLIQVLKPTVTSFESLLFLSNIKCTNCFYYSIGAIQLRIIGDGLNVFFQCSLPVHEHD